MASATEDQVSMIEDCQKRESQLTNWEVKFLDSVDHLMGKGFGLTMMQDKTLTAIWERVTDNG